MKLEDKEKNEINTNKIKKINLWNSEELEQEENKFYEQNEGGLDISENN